MKILFHAINGFGLGHVVRLSVISEGLNGSPNLTAQQMISPSPSASEYFTGPCRRVPCDLADPVRHDEHVLAYVNEFEPDAMIFDTRWPEKLPRYLFSKQVKRVLVLRALPLERMGFVADQARQNFESVLLPHAWDELAYYYGSDSDLMKIISEPPFTAVGPLARVSSSLSTNSVVIFTMGAGKPYLTNVDAYMETYVKTAEILFDNGFRDLRFLVGPLLADSPPLGHLTPLRNASVHELLGPNCCIVNRGGYNTCWEAIGSGSHLVVSSTHNPVEDIEARSKYFDERGFARKASFEARAIAEAVMRGHAPNVDAGRKIVNCGLSNIVQAILE
jgi:hypothetical protein